MLHWFFFCKTKKDKQQQYIQNNNGKIESQTKRICVFSISFVYFAMWFFFMWKGLKFYSNNIQIVHLK